MLTLVLSYIKKGSLPKILGFIPIYVLLTAPQILREIHANDCWKALYSGRYLSVFNKFPHHSTFTFASTVDFLSKNTFNWLGNQVIYQIHTTLGYPGLQFFRIVVALTATLLVLWLLNFRLNFFVGLLLIFHVWGFSQKLRTRTAMFSVICASLLCFILIRSRSEQRPEFLYFLLPLLVLWSNLHGSYLLGIGLFGVYCVGELLEWLIDRSKRNQENLPTLFSVMLLIIPSVIFIKPFPDYELLDRGQNIVNLPAKLFVMNTTADKNTTENLRSKRKNQYQSTQNWYQLMKEFLQTALFPKKSFRSNEYQFPLESLNFWFVKFSIVISAITFLVFLIFYRKVPISYWLLFATVVFVGLGRLRTTPYISLVSIPLLASLVKKQRIRSSMTYLSIQTISFILLSMLSGYVGYHVVSNKVPALSGQSYITVGLGKTERKFSSNVPSYILKNVKKPKVINSYNSGSYLVWKWWPYKQVFIDTKSLAYTPAFWEELVSSGIDGAAEKLNINYLLNEKIYTMAGRPVLIEPEIPSKHAWKILTQDPTFALFKRFPRQD